MNKQAITMPETKSFSPRRALNVLSFLLSLPLVSPRLSSALRELICRTRSPRRIPKGTAAKKGANSVVCESNYAEENTNTCCRKCRKMVFSYYYIYKIPD